jgi:murein DD-endopeptidase MepM/ murein hydrolase activator NlpD
VKRGDVIAVVGSTGIATSAHLHYEVHVNGVAQDPKNFILPEQVRY